MLGNKLGRWPKSTSEQDLWALQNSINRIQMHCVQEILKTLKTYMLKHLPQCDTKQAMNAAALKPQITQHLQQQRTVQNKEVISQWSKTVPIKPVHTPTQNELEHFNAAVKKTAGATFEKTRHQFYKANVVQRTPQQDGTEKYLANVIGPENSATGIKSAQRIVKQSVHVQANSRDKKQQEKYIMRKQIGQAVLHANTREETTQREQLNAEKTGARKNIPARTESLSKSNVGAKVGSNTMNHVAAPVQYQTQRNLAALWQSRKDSGDSLHTLNTPGFLKGVKGNWKPQVPTKSETLTVNGIKGSGPSVQPFRRDSSILYSRESALNRPRVRQEGQMNEVHENDVTRYIALNARNEEHLRRQNSGMANKSARRFFKQSVDVQANSQYAKKQQGKYILRKEVGQAVFHAKTREEAAGGFLSSPDGPPQYQHRNLDATKGQQIGENFSLQRAEKGGHGHLLMELQENSLELLEEKTLPQNRIVGSRGTKWGKSGLVKTVGEVNIKGQPTRLSSQKLTVDNPRSYSAKTHLRPYGRLALDHSQDEDIHHKRRSDARDDLQDDSITDFRQLAQRSSAQIPVAAASSSIEKESIMPPTPNKVFNDASHNVRTQNSEPPKGTGKQNEQTFNRPPVRLTPQAQQSTSVKQAPKRNMTVPETGMQHKLDTVVDLGRQGNPTRNSMPLPGITNPQRPALTGQVNSVLDHHSRSNDSSRLGFKLRATSLQHPTLLHKGNSVPGSIKQPYNKQRQSRPAQVSGQQKPIPNQPNYYVTSRPPEAMQHESASGSNAPKVVQPTHIHKKAATSVDQPTAKHNPSSVEPTGASQSYKNVVTSKPLAKIKVTRPVHALQPILQDRNKPGSSRFQIPKNNQSSALDSKDASQLKHVLNRLKNQSAPVFNLKKREPHKRAADELLVHFPT
ncbi:uncharacterized protein LOC125757736 [Rhipicephalus sanguineus]|uniref:uncharacterized protein LOC125757736 n=1 Tax=Rhipicephalus sanguineus TaxID=34632 RepID=UPI0020C3AF56|nr:uncharacterized protein LOC125757736 [Rhipicephalus sanguineus]